jgi:hypothetical protein
MFGELPKLFDRNFAVGFFLPVAIFIIFSGLILGQYPFVPDINALLGANLLIGTTIVGLISWIGGIVLLAINRDLYRLMEGYGSYNPLRIFGWWEKQRYRRLVQTLEKLDDEYRKWHEAGREFPAVSRIRRNLLMRQLAEEFPDKEEYLLPTPFGNILRSFEVYPRVMYGLDSIDAWGRLLAVIPKDYLQLIDAAKAQVDFWINLELAVVLLLVEYEVFALTTGSSLNLWIVFLLLVLGTIAPLRATNSAGEWGGFIKSAFDVYRFKLLESLGMNAPKNREEERRLWKQYSQAIIYRLPDSLPDLKKDTSEPVPEKDKSES